MIKKFFSKLKFKHLVFLLVAVNAGLIFLIITSLGKTGNDQNYSIRNLLIGSKLETSCKDCNVIMVSLDTLSSNHLPCYGYYRDTSPNLCSFADQNITFENAYSNATWTLPSHVSLFTGLYPFNAGVNQFMDKLDKNKILLPELLKSNGYNTMMFLPPDILSFPIGDVYGRLGDSVYSNANYSWQQSIDMFKQSVRSKKKTFMFLHTYAVHAPYNIQGEKQIYDPINTKFPTNPTEYNKIQWTPEFVNRIVTDINKGINTNWYFEAYRDKAEIYFPELQKAYPNYNKEVEVLNKIADTGMLWDYLFYQNYIRLINPNDQKDVETLRALYDQTINILDDQKIYYLENLINDPEFSKNTILVIFADHGEEFMEHGQLWHTTIYNSNIRVPLIMHIPGVKDTKIYEPVQLVDVFPTITELLGMNKKIKVDGNSLVRRIYGLDNSNELIVTDGLTLDSKALIYGPWKLLLGVQNDKKYLPYELYNIYDDPTESRNVLFENTNIKNEILKKYTYPLIKN